MNYRDLLPFNREELRELIDDGIRQVNEEIDLNEEVDPYSFRLKMNLLKQLNTYYDKKAHRDFKEKMNKKIESP